MGGCFIISSIQYLNNIPVNIDRTSVLNRLGFKKNITVFTKNDEKQIDGIIQKASFLYNSQGAFLKLNLSKQSEETISLENGYTFKSKNLAKFLYTSNSLVLMFTTVGKDIVSEIDNDILNSNASSALILDAVASIATDSLLNYLMEFINKLLKKDGEKLTNLRFSPGYGDLELINQRYIYEILRLESLGIKITEKNMLIPEKSVIAIAGIVIS